jgi:hypothetical protein
VTNSRTFSVRTPELVLPTIANQGANLRENECWNLWPKSIEGYPPQQSRTRYFGFPVSNSKRIRPNEQKVAFRSWAIVD